MIAPHSLVFYMVLKSPLLLYVIYSCWLLFTISSMPLVWCCFLITLMTHIVTVVYRNIV